MRNRKKEIEKIYNDTSYIKQNLQKKITSLYQT